MDNTVVHFIHLVVRLSNDGKWAQLTAINLQPAVRFKAKKKIIVLYMIWNEVKLQQLTYDYHLFVHHTFQTVSCFD